MVRSERVDHLAKSVIKLPPADQAEMMKRLSTVGDEVVASQPRLKEVYDLMVNTAKVKR